MRKYTLKEIREIYRKAWGDFLCNLVFPPEPKTTKEKKDMREYYKYMNELFRRGR
jgi:hypothetical protein